jgi:Fic family protein
MMTFKQFAAIPKSIPAAASWYLADLGEAKGKQELFTRQAPQKLKALREHALIESAVSSNRIEGVTVEPGRVKAVVLGKALLQDRDEEEVRGYRQALDVIHKRGADLPVSEETILELHRLARGDIWDGGKYKEKDGDIIERYPNGRERVRFKTVPAAKTPDAMRRLLEMWDLCLKERWVHPLVASAAFNLDFLCVHPFRDGNGRVSRLLFLLQTYHLGYEVGRYISLERLIEENKERYYETLESSSQGWHQGRHDPWPYINFLLYILKTAYREFEGRVGELKTPRGTKTEFIHQAADAFSNPFTLAELERKCPQISRDMVRKVLREMQKKGQMECLGRGPGALWQKKGITLKRG